MNRVITSSEVAALAFGGAQNLRPAEISLATIVAAERKFIRPVLGGLYDAVASGAYADFAAEYLKMPLALYVKYLLLPAMAAQVGMTGVVQYCGEEYGAADSKTFRRLLRRVKSDADALMDSAVDFIEAHLADFPEYDPKLNVRHRLHLAGNVVL